ncbi:hypothetical protein ACH4TV_43820 [Streptomyces sp. NPDC020898]|uniref:hypothetical protein n=1 Tax=Streptomyces sp. NPDC020898 TaxID=3365101 RepID=UPI0037B9E531
MTDHHQTYGTSTHTADELTQLVGDRLGLAFTERDSHFLGVYYVADIPGRKIEIQPNRIPGDDDEDDLYAPEHPTVRVLLLTTTPAPDAALRAELTSVERLVHLTLGSAE